MAQRLAEDSARPIRQERIPTMARMLLTEEQVQRVFGQRINIRGSLSATMRSMVTDSLSSGKWVPVKVRAGGNITRVMSTISSTARELGYWGGKKLSVVFSEVKLLPNGDGAVFFSFRVSECQETDMECEASVFEQDS